MRAITFNCPDCSVPVENVAMFYEDELVLVGTCGNCRKDSYFKLNEAASRLLECNMPKKKDNKVN